MNWWNLYNFTGNSSQKKPQQAKGFTIVEILVVVVVIAILAAITIVSFNGITRRATETSTKAELSNASKAFEVDQIDKIGYDPTGSARLVTETSNATISYVYGTTQYYCMVARSKSNPSVVFNLSNQTGSSIIGVGECATPSFSSQSRCLGGTIVAQHTIKNDTSQAISMKPSYTSGNPLPESYALNPGESKSVAQNLRVTSVTAGILTFSIYNSSGTVLNETFYQYSPAQSC